MPELLTKLPLGDFDGDGKIDTAVLVEDKTGNKGIEVRFSNKKIALIGAGEVIGNGFNRVINST